MNGHFLEGTKDVVIFWLIATETDKCVDDLTISILGTDHSVSFITFFFVRFSPSTDSAREFITTAEGNDDISDPLRQDVRLSGGQRDRKSNRKYHAVYITDKGLTRRRDRFKTDRMTTAF